ncbi:Type 3 secretion system secretin [Campylobacter suis]|uniref:Type 3 secretion system secretin n=2 Tax=Campylobacter suis TaxID=2790657 RepID=A0ABN7K6X5_9BACT|nr:Type 3 secretion system secretin [Campylobacter suis]
MLKSSKILIFLMIFLTNLNATSCINKNLSMKLTNDGTTLSEAINEIADICGFSVVAKDMGAQKILEQNATSININNLSLNDVFNVLIAERNLNYEFSKNILKISALKTQTFKLDYITSVRTGVATTKASVDSAPIEIGENQANNKQDSTQDNIITSTERFDFWEKLNEELKAILNNGAESIITPDPVINQNAGLITITATPSQLARASSYIENMQKRLKRQVLIDVSIISVELKNEYKRGVDWSKFELGFNSYIGNDSSRTSGIVWENKTNSFSDGFSRTLSIAANLNFSLDGVLNFLETNGKAKVISSPKVTTLNNQQALISVGDNINYRVQEENESGTINSRTTTTYKQYSVFIGILLNLLPEISDDNKIMLHINPSLSSFKYREDDARSTLVREIAPDTNQKKLSTVVHVNNGDTIILGGLIGQTKGKDNTQVPFLSAIPLIGNAFKSNKEITSTTELIFIITPKIVDASNPLSPNTKTLKELGFSGAM